MKQILSGASATAAATFALMALLVALARLLV
jgi:hypothetical protein